MRSPKLLKLALACADASAAMDASYLTLNRPSTVDGELTIRCSMVDDVTHVTVEHRTDGVLLSGPVDVLRTSSDNTAAWDAIAKARPPEPTPAPATDPVAKPTPAPPPEQSPEVGA